MANYLSAEKRKRIYQLLCEGNGFRSVTRLVPCSIAAAVELQKRFCGIIEFLNRRYIKNLDMIDIEADEIRTFVYKKNNIRWIYIALDRKSRLVIHFHIGKRDTNDANIFLTGLSDKLKETSRISTDCLKSYTAAVAKTPLGYLPTGTESIYLLRARTFGNALTRDITNRVESHNGNVRQHVSRLTRKTRCFSKKELGLYQQLTLFFFYYNFIKKQKTIKTTPALFAKIIHKPFSIDDLVAYDLMFTGNVNNTDTLNSYGKVGGGFDKDEMEIFLAEMSNIEGTKRKGVSGAKYSKLKIVA
jgi:IS1 family transposase